jgi:hypothetical protein
LLVVRTTISTIEDNKTTSRQDIHINITGAKELVLLLIPKRSSKTTKVNLEGPSDPFWASRWNMKGFKVTS